VPCEHYKRALVSDRACSDGFSTCCLLPIPFRAMPACVHACHTVHHSPVYSQVHYPASIDNLARERALFEGPGPILLGGLSETDLALLLAGDRSMSQVG
jgi:hypothetical protein